MEGYHYADTKAINVESSWRLESARVLVNPIARVQTTMR